MKKTTRRGLIYFRYIFPPIAVLAMLILMGIPCYRFITADTGKNVAISLGELLGNSWGQVRHYLFSGESTQDAATAYFSKYVLGLVIGAVVLFALGAVSVIYATVSGFAHVACGGADTRSRALFITLVPNRVLLCVYHALMLPIFFFPTYLPRLYDGILNYRVAVVCSPFNMLYIALGLYVASAVLIFLTARYERLEGIDLFFKRRSFERKVEEQTYEEQPDEAEDAYSRMDRRAREEQAQRIIKLLNKDNENEEDK